MDVGLLRTRVVLARMAGESERLGEQLRVLGLVGFVERSEWLFEHRSADEKLLWERRWRVLDLIPAGERARVQPTKACVRCGVTRTVRPGRDRGLCSDCLWVLSAEEAAIWTGRGSVA